MYGQLVQALQLKHADILNVYPFGSRVYETSSYNSDYDFIIVGNTYLTKLLGTKLKNDEALLLSGSCADKHFHALVHDTQSFTRNLKQHSLHTLECYFLPGEQALLKTAMFNFDIDKKMLRNRIMQKAVCDWEKSKKRFADGKVERAKKSLFHSLRVLDFGIQIAEGKKINNYTSCSLLWKDIKLNISENGTDYEDLFKERFHDMVIRLKGATT